MQEQEKNRINIIIIDDDEHFCKGVKASLSDLPVNNVVGIFHRGKEALTWLQTHTADLAIVDYYMPELHGMELIKRLKADFPAMKLIMISSESDPYLLRQVLETDAVHALLTKGAFNVLPNAIDAAMQNKTYLQPELGILIHKAERDSKKLVTLTKTQYDCLEFTAQGKSLEEIARLQNTTVNTVKDRLVQCRKKLGEKTTENLIKHYQKFFPKEVEGPWIPQQTEKNQVQKTAKQTEEKQVLNYERLLSGFRNNKATVNKLCHLFLEDIEQKEKDLMAAYKAQDWEMLKSQNHKLLGGVYSIKAERLGDACEQLQTTIQKKDIELIHQTMDCVIKEIEAVKKYLREEVGL